MEPLQTQPEPLQRHIFKNLVIFFILVFSFITTFAAGYFLHEIFKGETLPTQTRQVTPIPTKSPTKTSIPKGKESDTTLFIPGKTYFDDTIIAITKDTPHKAIAISARRIEQEKDYTQRTGFSFFDGQTWIRKLDNKTTPSSQIVTNELIKYWEVTVHPSRVLRESIAATLAIDGKTITVKAENLSNEISMRSLPGYTKFMSNKQGRMTIDGKDYDAYILYTRIYSLNNKDIQFYDQPLGLTTFWIAFWDSAGNFYHIDKSSVERPTDVYKTHEVAVLETPLGSVEKSFAVTITPDATLPPKTASLTTNLSNNAILSIQRESVLNKAPDTSYTWTMSTITGSIQSSSGATNGFGLMEYIHD